MLWIMKYERPDSGKTQKTRLVHCEYSEVLALLQLKCLSLERIRVCMKYFNSKLNHEAFKVLITAECL